MRWRVWLTGAGLAGVGLVACAGEVQAPGGDQAGFADGGAGAAGSPSATGPLEAGASDGGASSAGSGASAGMGGAGQGTQGAGGMLAGEVDAGFAQAADAGPVDPVDDAMPGIGFVGRSDMRDPQAVRFAWSGSGLRFRFEGTGASVLLDDLGGYFTLLIDDQSPALLWTEPGEHSYPVAGDLPFGEHEVALYRRTEALFGVTHVLGVEVERGGRLLSPPASSERKLEVIGDSITCGFGNEGLDQSCDFEPSTENHFLTYAAITARALSAELTTIAWSGKGVVYNYGDDIVEPLPELYDRSLPEDPTSTWDFARFQPDAVIINLGTNDFSTDNDPSEALFTEAYAGFVSHLRERYPDAWIVALVPTLLDGQDYDTAEAYITRVVDESDDPRLMVAALQFEQQGWGCAWHPSLSTHASMADALTAELRTLLGW